MINVKATQIINCNEKRRFLSRAEADASIGSMTAGFHRKKPPPLFAYECQICRGWHKTRQLRPEGTVHHLTKREQP